MFTESNDMHGEIEMTVVLLVRNEEINHILFSDPVSASLDSMYMWQKL